MSKTHPTAIKRLFSFALLSLIAGLISACSGQSSALVPTLTPYPTVGAVTELDVVCADFLTPAVRVLAARYQRHNPNVIITVVQRVDTLGYPLLLVGDVDLAILNMLK